jgi:hypothetical protein
MVPDLYRTILAYVREHLKKQPKKDRENAERLIDTGKYRIRSHIVDDLDADNGGLVYVLDLLPDDGPAIPLVTVQLSKVATADEGLLEGKLDESPHNDPSARTER